MYKMDSATSSNGVYNILISKLTYPFHLALSSLPTTITGMFPNYYGAVKSGAKSTFLTKNESTDSLPFSVTQLTPTVTFMSVSQDAQFVSSLDHLRNFSPEGRPLCIMLCWLQAEFKGIKNYAKFYIDNGFDVVAARISALDVIMPTRLEEIIQRELIPVLIRVKHEKSVIHGFSVGGYFCARLLSNLENSPTEVHAKFIETLRCTVWDSVVDINYAKLGISCAMFPSSQLLQNLFLNYMDLHMKVFYNSCTKYLEEGNEYAYQKPVPVPALFLYSDTDYMSPTAMNLGLKNAWESLGIPCRSKIFTGSNHVLHMKTYPTEYQSAVREFLEENELISW